jgi:rfaE bifunctional protein nucleotidyltransferase chain/domain
MHLLVQGSLAELSCIPTYTRLIPRRYDVVVVADYGSRASGWLDAVRLEEAWTSTPPVLIELLHRSALEPLALAVDVPLRLVVISASDAIEGFTLRHLVDLARVMRRLALSPTKEPFVLATLGEDGCLLKVPGRRHVTWVPTRRVIPALDTTGAGDLLVTALARRVRADMDSDINGLVTAIERAQADVADFLEGLPINANPAAGESSTTVRNLVVVGGCFDPPHRAHVALLRRAARLGRVVVALNSDDSVARVKGPGRPFLPLADRVAVLGAMRWVDEVIAFEDPTPDTLLRSLRPDVFVKGNDYVDDLPEAALVEELGGVAVAVCGDEVRSSTTLLRSFAAKSRSLR